MKSAIMAFAFAALTATAAQAGQVDLSSFSVTGSGSVASNYGVATGTASISGMVSNLTSFEWNFTTADYLPFDDNAFFITTGTGSIMLSSVATGPYFDSTGWQTYTLATPYSGSLTFGVMNVGDNNHDSYLELRNIMTSVAAVPEPETYAMLLAGLGLVGLMKRRKSSAV